jgi:hypothetical protein
MLSAFRSCPPELPKPSAQDIPMKLSGPNVLLRLEGLAVLVFASLVYASRGFSWTEFLVLFLVPDLVMVGYFWGARIGAVTYDAGHTYCAPLLLGLLARFSHHPALIPIALIWAAHIGFDRLMGYGLKYGTGFKETHLGRV